MVLTVYISMSFVCTNRKSKWSNIRTEIECIYVFNSDFRHRVSILNVKYLWVNLKATITSKQHIHAYENTVNPYILLKIVAAQFRFWAKSKRIVRLQLSPLFCVCSFHLFIHSFILFLFLGMFLCMFHYIMLVWRPKKFPHRFLVDFLPPHTHPPHEICKIL